MFMAFVAAKCTQCGGSLQVDDSKDAGICPFCGTAFVTEKVIKNYNFNITNNIDTVIVQNNEKAGLKERCQAYLEVQNYYELYNFAYKAIGEYPNELFFYACCLFSVIKSNPKKIKCIAYINLESLYKKALPLAGKASEWERSVLNDVEKYLTDMSLMIEYDSLASYYQQKYHINYEKARKKEKLKNINSELKQAFISVRSIFLFWIPLIVFIGLAVVSIVFSDYELSGDVGSSPLFYVMVAIIVYSVIAFLGNIYVLYTSIRDGLNAYGPVVETLSDFLNNRVKY